MRIWLAINSAGLLVVAGCLYLVIRQVGIMLSRLGPVGARATEGEGPRIGEHLGAQVEELRRLTGSLQRPVLFLFASTACSICPIIRRAAETLAPHWSKKVAILLVYDEPLEGGVPAVSIGPALWMCHQRSLRTSLSVFGVPFGVALDQGAVVVEKGLVNEISHVESLLEAIPGKFDGSAPRTGEADGSAAQKLSESESYVR